MSQRSSDESQLSATWFTGALILAVYLVFAMTLYLLPPQTPAALAKKTAVQADPRSR